MKQFVSIFSVILFFAGISFAQIILDEDFSDWDAVEVLYDDSADDLPGAVSFGKLKIFNDDRNIYFFIEIGKELNFQDNNFITIYIDADNNSATGKAILGIGAEIEFIFGQRRGYTYSGGSTSNISHIDIGMVSSPTVSSDKFEFAISRNGSANLSLFSGNTIKVIFENAASAGDLLPNETGGVEYILTDSAFISPSYSIAKLNSTDLRLMSFNVRRDDLFNSGKKEYFGRLISAVSPDIIGFQEIYSHSSQETANLINEFIPAEWFHAKLSNDNICLSRYPIKSSYAIDGNAAFVIDISDSSVQREMLFISAHPPCCDNNDQRQSEIDHIMAFVRDAKNGTGQLALKDKSPIVIVGDMNLVGYARQQYTLYSGDILNESSFGEDFTPDWDGTFLDDAIPTTTGTPFTFTWYSENSSFSPGRLDYIVYSGSVLEMNNSFSLFTPMMPPDSLIMYNLTPDDSKFASDHTPVVADFQFKLINSVSSLQEIPETLQLFQNYPNPFNPTTKIKFSIPSAGTHPDLSGGSQMIVQLKIYDILGREVITLVNEKYSPGFYEVVFNAEDLPSGVYFYSLRTGTFTATKKLLLVK